MKQRFDSLDVTVIVRELRQALVGLRVANIYDLDHKSYLFKLAQTDRKEFLLIESGTRVHLTDFTRDKSKLPSVFALKVL